MPQMHHDSQSINNLNTQTGIGVSNDQQWYDRHCYPGPHGEHIHELCPFSLSGMKGDPSSGDVLYWEDSVIARRESNTSQDEPDETVSSGTLKFQPSVLGDVCS